jgi:PAS domain S-box-containing protein
MREMLSPREHQLLEMAVSGMTDQAMANNLGISIATVGTYWGRVRIKFGPFSRTELVALYLKDEAKKVIDSLKTENSALLAQVDQHAETEQMLKTTLDLFRGLIETAPDAILLVNSDGSIELANDRASEMFGYTSEELLGMKIENLIPPRYHEQHVRNRREYTERPVRRKMGEHLATIALRKDGLEFPVAAALNSTAAPKGQLVTCIVRDMSGGRAVPNVDEWQLASE